MDPAVIAAQLCELSMYYELDGDRHRAFAYARASKSIGAATGLARLLDEGRVDELPGVGPSIARAVGELARRGNLDVLDRMRAKWPPVVLELASLPRLGVSKARTLWQAFDPADLDAVALLCRAGAIRSLKGFGAISEAGILDAIEERRRVGVRALLVDAMVAAEALATQLRRAHVRVEIAGPVRRWIEEVDHLAFVIEGEGPQLDGLPSQLASGLRVELFAAPPAQFGWAHVRATGSAEHVALLEERARARGVDLATLVAPDETAVYRSLGLPWLPPEVRDGTDELSGDDFTDLVTLADLTTATHCHTTASDGKHTIAEMAAAAGELGFRALTITDHSAAAAYAGGLDAARLRAQAAEIRALRADGTAIQVLHGTEADILADGTIDVPAEMLPELDLVIASVHQRFGQGEDEMTDRLVTAMRQPFFKIWGHALGRLVLRRRPIDVRIDDVFDAIAASRAAIELNGDPHRLDLPPALARRAAARGIKFVLSSDAHSAENLRATRFAVAMARRARLRRRDVLNALPVDELAAIVRPT
ncbi:MAG: PHP domain-containing protein [Proteobacteria bacterium]|nr:PHP domain-containing protein [Pseudomonadota bacterium]